MTMKIHELAKELNLNSKELVEKIHNMGIEAKSHMSVLSDIEATAVKNTVLRSKGATETKIVKVAPKKVESGQDFEEPRVVVKASVVPQQTQQQKTAKPQHGAGEDRTHSHKPPMGKPVISRELDQRTQKPPMGRPVAPSDWRAEPCQNHRLLHQNTRIRRLGHNSRDWLKKVKDLHQLVTDRLRGLHKPEKDLLRDLHKQETDRLRGLHKPEKDLLRDLHKQETDLHRDCLLYTSDAAD